MSLGELVSGAPSGRKRATSSTQAIIQRQATSTTQTGNDEPQAMADTSTTQAQVQDRQWQTSTTQTQKQRRHKYNTDTSTRQAMADKYNADTSTTQTGNGRLACGSGATGKSSQVGDKKHKTRQQRVDRQALTDRQTKETQRQFTESMQAVIRTQTTTSSTMEEHWGTCGTHTHTQPSHTHTRTHTSIYQNTNPHANTYAHANMYTHLHVYVHTHTPSHAHRAWQQQAAHLRAYCDRANTIVNGPGSPIVKEKHAPQTCLSKTSSKQIDPEKLSRCRNGANGAHKYEPSPKT